MFVSVHFVYVPVCEFVYMYIGFFAIVRVCAHVQVCMTSIISNFALQHFCEKQNMSWVTESNYKLLG